MDDEPPADLPPPKRPWSIWQWLMRLTPSLLMIVGAAKGIRPQGTWGVLESLNYTVPIAILICLFLASKLAEYTRKDNRFVAFMSWLLCFTGLVAVNFAVAFAGCAMVVK